MRSVSDDSLQGTIRRAGVELGNGGLGIGLLLPWRHHVHSKWGGSQAARSVGALSARRGDELLGGVRVAGVCGGVSGGAAAIR